MSPSFALARRVFAGLMFIAPATLFAATHSLPNDSWQLMAIPGDPGTRSVAELFGDELPMADYGRTWTLFVPDATGGDYGQPAADDTLRTGRAFWMIQRTGRDVTLELPTRPPAGRASSACPSAAGCIELPLQALAGGTSWSALGAPFDRAVRVADLRLRTSGGTCAAGCDLDAAAATGITSDAVWTYDPAVEDYARLGTTDRLAPWRGFWIPLRADAAATLLIPAGTTNATSDIEARNAALGRGINLGNALEAPSEGAWGMELQDWHFEVIAGAGFDSVRIPIRWSAHAAETAPYTIDAAFFERIDRVLEQSARNGLVAVPNVHHYEELMDDPRGEHRSRLLALWRQIAERYAGRADDAVYFELLNEPTGQFDEEPALWNALLADTLAVVRESNPTRPVVVGPVGWNSIDRLDVLELPDDPNLIATVHFYSPFPFTHQGATWVEPTPPVGVPWRPGTTGLGASFENYSWDTTLTGSAGVLSVAYTRRYGGFNMHRIAPYAPSRLTLDTRGRVDVSVACQGSDQRVDPDEFAEVGEIVAHGTAWRSHAVDLSACGDGTRNVVLQTRLPGTSGFDLRAAEICSTAGCDAVVATAAEAIEQRLDVAARWADAAGVPVFVGEFGAFGAGDMASRARWTATVQGAARRSGMSSAYWEFGAGFGVYDREAGTWREPLLDALLD